MGKKLIIIAVLLLAVGFLGFVYQKSRPPEQALVPTPTMGPTAPPAYPSFPQAATKDQPSYILNAPALELPGSLPTVTLVQSLSIQAAATRVAQSLGFSGNPTVISGKNGTLYTWQQGEQTLVVGGNPPAVSYVNPSNSQSKFGSNKISTDTLVQDFLQKTGTSVAGIVLKQTQTTFFEPNLEGPRATTNSTNATRQKTDYRYEINGYPLYSQYPGIPALSILVDSRGDIEQLNAKWYAGILTSNTVSPLVTYQESLRRLQSREGVLLAADVKDPPLTDIPAPLIIRATSVTKAELAYYYSPANAILSPVLVFYGSGTDTLTNKTVDTLTVVSLTP